MIWNQIAASVSKKVCENYSNLFKDQYNKLLIKLLYKAYDQMEFNIDGSQKSLQNSEGYKQYCSQLLKQSGFFAKEIQKQCEKVENQIRGISHVPSL